MAEGVQTVRGDDVGERLRVNNRHPVLILLVVDVGVAFEAAVAVLVEQVLRTRLGSRGCALRCSRSGRGSPRKREGRVFGPRLCATAAPADALVTLPRRGAHIVDRHRHVNRRRTLVAGGHQYLVDFVDHPVADAEVEARYPGVVYKDPLLLYR